MWHCVGNSPWPLLFSNVAPGLIPLDHPHQLLCLSLPPTPTNVPMRPQQATQKLWGQAPPERSQGWAFPVLHWVPFRNGRTLNTIHTWVSLWQGARRSLAAPDLHHCLWQLALPFHTPDTQGPRPHAWSNPPREAPKCSVHLLHLRNPV